MIERLLASFVNLRLPASGLPRVANLLLGLLSILTLLLSWLQWSTIYAGLGAFPPVAIAAIVSVLAGLILAERTSTPSRSVPIGLMILLLGCAAWYGSQSNALLGDLVGSWKLLASTGLLVPITQKFVLVPVITVFVAGWVAAEIITRKRTIGSIVLPLALSQTVALAYTVSQRQPQWWDVALIGFFVFAMFGVSRADHHPDHAATGGSLVELDRTTAIRWRQALVSLPFAGLVALVGVGFSQLVTSTISPFDLRERLVRPLNIFESTSPLSLVKAGLVSPDPADVFAITVDDLPSEESINRITVATLDLFDGALWTSSARFESAGATLPSPAQAQLVNPRQLVQTVQVLPNYPFNFLPRIGEIQQTDSSLLGWDSRSGSIASIQARDEAFTYTTRVRTPAASAAAGREVSNPPLTSPNLTEATLTDPRDSLRYAASLPDMTDEQSTIFAQLIGEATAGARTDFEAITLLEEFLRSDSFSYNPDAPAGHSLAALASYLDQAEDGGQRIGFTEQSAATFAVAVRMLGIPTRIVVGYRLDQPLTWDNNRVLISEDMIHAWPEVWFDGVGWVAFEPTNDANKTSEQTSRTPAIGDDAAASRSSDLPELQEPVLIPEPARPGVAKRRLTIAAIVLALPIVFFLAVVVIKRIRRQR